MNTDHSKAVLDGQHSHGYANAQKPESSRADRKASFSLDEIGIPTGREENWRFTPISKFTDFFNTDLHDSAISVSVNETEHFKHEVVGRDDARLGTVSVPTERTSTVVWNTFEKAHVLTIEADSKLEEPVIMKLHADACAKGVQHIYVDAQAGSESVVILEHTGDTQLSQSIEVNVGENANLTFVSIQEWDQEAIHLSDHRCQLGANANLKHIVVTLGGDLVRITPEAKFLAEGSNVEMLGIYFTDAGQHQEHRLFIDHSVPKCYSRVTYKGALQGENAHSVWIGDVLIGANATGTDTYELNRNLVLTKGAKADSVPNLEIETGEIEGAGHASATGRFDDEQLFYLTSRGIDPQSARRLVVRGFFAELINQIGVAHVCDHLNQAIEKELEKSGE